MDVPAVLPQYRRYQPRHRPSDDVATRSRTDRLRVQDAPPITSPYYPSDPNLDQEEGDFSRLSLAAARR